MDLRCSACSSSEPAAAASSGPALTVARARCRPCSSDATEPSCRRPPQRLRREAAPPGDSVSAPGLTVIDGFGGRYPGNNSSSNNNVTTAAAPLQRPAVTPPASKAATTAAKHAKAKAATPPPPPAPTSEADTAAIDETPAPAAKAPPAAKKQVAAAEPAASAGASGANGYVVVLASIPASGSSRLDALSSFADMQQKYGTVLASKTPDVQEANLGDKGMFTALLVGPPGSRDASLAALHAAQGRRLQGLLGYGILSTSLSNPYCGAPRSGAPMIVPFHAPLDLSSGEAMRTALITGVAGPTLAPREAAFLKEARPAGLILFARNLESHAQIRALIDAVREAVGARRPAGPHRPGRRARAAPEAAALARASAGSRLRRSSTSATRWRPRRAAFAARGCSRHDLRALGINTDCAPVLDVPVAGAHDIIGDRAYGDRSAQVVALGRGGRRRASWPAACCRSSSTSPATGGRRRTATSRCPS